MVDELAALRLAVGIRTVLRRRHWTMDAGTIWIEHLLRFPAAQRQLRPGRCSGPLVPKRVGLRPALDRDRSDLPRRHFDRAKLVFAGLLFST